MKIINFSDFQNIKQRVSAECDKRTEVHSQSTSLKTYGTSGEYSYIIPPQSFEIILNEHYKKIIIPLQAFNSIFNTYESNDNIIKEDFLLQADSFLTVAEKRVKTDQNYTDCTAESCTGLCYKTCISDCGNDVCTSVCGQSCTGTCSGDSCGVGCSSVCGGLCDDNCYSACKGRCNRLCADNACSANCASGCGGYCDHVQCAPNGCSNYTYTQ